MSVDTKKLVIVDTDPGVDDAMALLFLQTSSMVGIHSITTVFGNSSVEATTRNAAYLVDRFGLDVPVIRGADRPLARSRFMPELKVHGEDGLGDTGVAKYFQAPDSEIDAARHIVETVKQNPGKVTLLAIAPLTNLALALQIAPEISELVDEVVVMGGAFGGKGRTGNIRAHAEANIFFDPEAANLVFGANWAVTIVGLDVTLECILSSDDAQDLAQAGGDAGAFLWEISRGYEKIYRDLDGIEGCCIHDVAAAVYVVHPDWFEADQRAVCVGLTAGREGETVQLDVTSDRPLHKICRAVDGKQVVSKFIETIKSRVPHPVEDHRLLRLQ